MLLRGSARIMRFFRDYPCTASSAATIPLFALSDVIAQKTEQNIFKKKTTENDTQIIALPRVAAVATCAPVFNGSTLIFFYRWLDRAVGSGYSLKIAFKKIVIAQLTYMPASTIGFLFLSRFLTGLYESICDDYTQLNLTKIKFFLVESTDGIFNKSKDAYIISYFFWPVIDLVNFTILQKYAPFLRPTWDGLFDLIWNSVLSWMNFKVVEK